MADYCCVGILRRLRGVFIFSPAREKRGSCGRRSFMRSLPAGERLRGILFMRRERTWIRYGRRLYSGYVFRLRGKPGQGEPRVLTPLGELYLPLAGLVDTAAETARIEKEILKVEAELATVRKKLSNTNFVQNAPAAVVGA